MKKRIRLTESQLTTIIKRIVEEMDTQSAKLTPQMVKDMKKPDMGGKYCFSDKKLNYIINDTPPYNPVSFKKDFTLYKIKSGDTYGGFEDGQNVDFLNDLCKLKDKNGLKVGDVILMSNSPI